MSVEAFPAACFLLLACLAYSSTTPLVNKTSLVERKKKRKNESHHAYNKDKARFH
jgi:outer membrane biogenesis lipoprotein LolB